MGRLKHAPEGRGLRQHFYRDTGSCHLSLNELSWHWGNTCTVHPSPAVTAHSHQKPENTNRQGKEEDGRRTGPSGKNTRGINVFMLTAIRKTLSPNGS